MKLNLGCNDDHRPFYLNVDIAPPADQIVDLRITWPWCDGSVEEILANDVFEHLPSKIHTLNEACRVLVPGGRLSLMVPSVCLSDGRVNPGAFADPTHSSFWTIDDQYYFSEEWNHSKGERGRLGPGYGISALFRFAEWKLIEYGLQGARRSKIVGTLIKV